MYKQRLNRGTPSLTQESFAAFAVLFAIEGLNMLSMYPVLPYYIEWTLNLDPQLDAKSSAWLISSSYSFYVLVYNSA